MKLHEFSKRIGLPLSKLRFFARYGITKPERQNNNYRDFKDEDAIDIYNALMLRSFDMSIEDIVEIHQTNKTIEVDSWLNQNVQNLQSQIDNLKIRMNRLIELQKSIEQFQSLKGKPIFSPRFSECVLWSFSDDFILNNENIETLKKMTNSNPFSYIALRIKEEDWKTNEVFKPDLGIGILKKNLELSKLEIPENAVRTKDTDFVGFYVEKENLFALTMEDFQPLFDFAKENNVTLYGDISGRFYLSYPKNGKRIYCCALGMAYHKN